MKEELRQAFIENVVKVTLILCHFSVFHAFQGATLAVLETIKGGGGVAGPDPVSYCHATQTKTL